MMKETPDYQDEEKSGLHPLLIPTILNKVFGSLTFWHQKKCRLVCRTWDLEVCTFIRNRSKINLSKLIRHRIDLFVELFNIDKLCTSFTIEDESPRAQHFFKNIGFPVKFLELRNFPWSLPNLRELLLDALPHLEELRLPIQCILPPSDIMDLNLLLHSPAASKMISTLKKIIVSLTIQDLSTYNHKNTSINSLMELLQDTPNVEEIYYPNIVQFTSPLNNPARLLFENIIGNERIYFKNLSTLKIDTFLCNEDIELLQLRDFPLKSLQITLTPNITCTTLYSFLFGLEDTLNILTLTFRDGFRLTKKFPALKNLRWMSIIIWNGSLEFVNQIIKLKTLIVVLMEIETEILLQVEDCNNYSNYKYNGKKQMQYKELEELEIHAVRQGSPEIVQRLLYINPSITKLTIDNVTDKYFQTIFQCLPYLEELIILYGEFTDTGITGIPKQHLTNELWGKDFFAAELKKFAGISDLKYLRSLVLSGEITDFSVIFGVSKCRNLKSLELIGRFNSTITDRSLKKIADGMDLHYFRTKNLNGVSEIGVSYLENKLQGREVYWNA